MLQYVHHLFFAITVCLPFGAEQRVYSGFFKAVLRKQLLSVDGNQQQWANCGEDTGWNVQRSFTRPWRPAGFNARRRRLCRYIVMWLICSKTMNEAVHINTFSLINEIRAHLYDYNSQWSYFRLILLVSSARWSSTVSNQAPVTGRR